MQFFVYENCFGWFETFRRVEWIPPSLMAGASESIDIEIEIERGLKREGEDSGGDYVNFSDLSFGCGAIEDLGSRMELSGALSVLL